MNKIFLKLHKTWLILNKIDYRLYIAKYMMRLGKFHDKTDGASWITFFAGGIGWTFFKAMAMIDNRQAISGFGEASWFFIKGAVFLTLALYFIWEIVQGIKWFHTWAENYIRYERYSKEAQRRS